VAPLGGRIVPELDRHDLREVFLKTYRIVYRVAGEDIRVLTVLEGHRRLRLTEIDEE
jgi:plasmid stabilization system protein ParE